MKNAFIATVGMGTGPEVDITKPLIKSISEANPDFLLLFATAESYNYATKIKEELSRNDANTEICRLSDKDDVEKIFKEMSDKITNLISNGYEAKNIIADFTTGTKPMSAALALAATKHCLGRLKYVIVKRDKDRKICEGTERTLTFEPLGIFASYTIDIAINLMVKFRFESAIELLTQINTALLSPEEQNLVENLKNLAEAYSYWDKFEHIKFRATYQKANFANPLLQQFKVNIETLNLVHRIGEDAKKGVLSEYPIIDLVNNAIRRIAEGKYDDAVARFYRVVEMLAQWRLKVKYKIDSGDINLEEIPKKSIDWVNKCRDKSDNKIKISLQKNFQLLQDFNDELGVKFKEDKTLNALLNKRNNSILAHGIEPISADSCKSLGNLVMDYCRKFITEFDKAKNLLKFPWSKA